MHGLDDYVQYVHVYMSIYYNISIQYTVYHAGFILTVTVHDDKYMLKNAAF